MIDQNESPPSPIIGELRLRPALGEDAREVIAISSGRGGLVSHGSDQWTESQATALIDSLGQGLWSTPTLIEGSDGRVWGLLALVEVDPRDLSARLIAVLAEGDLSAAVRRYIELILWTYPLRRICVHVVDRRPEMSTLLAGVGFTREGVLCGAVLRNGRTLDLEVWSLQRVIAFGPVDPPGGWLGDDHV